MKKEVKTPKQEVMMSSTVWTTVLAGVFIVGICWFVFKPGSSFRPQTYFEKVPVTQEVAPINAGAVLKTHVTDGRTGESYAMPERVIPEKCRIYRGAYVQSGPVKGDWTRARYHANNPRSENECPDSTALLLRISELEEWDGKLERLAEDEANRVYILNLNN